MTPMEKERLRSSIADRLVEMEPLFDARCKLTFVMRSPHLPDGDLVVSNDALDKAIAALQRLSGYEAIKAVGTAKE